LVHQADYSKIHLAIYLLHLGTELDLALQLDYQLAHPDLQLDYQLDYQLAHPDLQLDYQLDYQLAHQVL